MQNTYQEKILDLENTNNSINKKLEGGIKFKIKSNFQPAGDQPEAIKKITENLKKNKQNQTLLGVTGSGKTFTMAHVIEKLQKPTFHYNFSLMIQFLVQRPRYITLLNLVDKLKFEL